MAINFRDRDIIFNEAVNYAMSAVYNAFTNLEELPYLKNLLNCVSNALQTDWMAKRPGPEEVFTDFLQSLIYFIYHITEHINDEPYQEKLVAYIIRHKKFIRKLNDQVILRVDPQEEVTVLITLARSGNHKDFESFLISLVTAFGLIEKNHGIKTLKDLLPFLQLKSSNLDIKELYCYLNHADKDGFTALSSACRNGQSEILKSLLSVVEILYGGKTTENFKKFITWEPKPGFGPLNRAILSGDLSTFQVITEAVFDAHKEDQSTLIKYLSHATDKSSFWMACTQENTAFLEQLIVNVVKKCFNDNKRDPKFIQFITTKSKQNSSLLHTACRFSKPKIVKILLNLVKELYNGEQTSSFENFLAARCDRGYSVLQQTCLDLNYRDHQTDQIKKSKREIIEILMKTAQSVYNNNPMGFLNFIKFKNEKYYSPSESILMTARFFESRDTVISTFNFLKNEFDTCADKYKKMECKQLLEAFLNHMNGNRFTLVNTICKNAKYVQTIYKKNQPEDLKLVILLIKEFNADLRIGKNKNGNALRNVPEEWKAEIVKLNCVKPNRTQLYSHASQPNNFFARKNMSTSRENAPTSTTQAWNWRGNF